MKKSNVYKLASLAAMYGLIASTVEEPERNTNNGKKPSASKVRTFRFEQSVLDLIEEYKDIKRGKSKKGRPKQLRIINKVEGWVKEGKILTIDLL